VLELESPMSELTIEPNTFFSRLVRKRDIPIVSLKGDALCDVFSTQFVVRTKDEGAARRICSDVMMECLTRNRGVTVTVKGKFLWAEFLDQYRTGVPASTEKAEDVERKVRLLVEIGGLVH